MTLLYPIVLETEDSGAVSAYVPGLPVYAAADSHAKAERAIRAALTAYLEKHPDSRPDAREAEQVAVCDLTSCFGLAELNHDRRRYSVGPEDVPGARDAELQQRIDRRPWRTATNRQLRADSDDPQLGERVGRPPLGRTHPNDPLPRHRMVLMGRHHEGDQDVHIEKPDHSEIAVAVEEAVDVNAGEHGGIRRHSKHGNAVPQVDVGIGQPLEQVFNEDLDRLSDFGGQCGHSFRETIVERDASRHVCLARRIARLDLHVDEVDPMK
jgi:predicted RNase H-like HicB family nuclease